MVKRGEEVPTFHQLFDLFWSGFYDSLRDLRRGRPGPGEMGVDLDDLLRQIAEMLQNMDGDLGDLSELAQAMLLGDLSQLEQMIRAAAEAARRPEHRELPAGRLLQPPHHGADGRRRRRRRAARPGGGARRGRHVARSRSRRCGA